MTLEKSCSLTRRRFFHSFLSSTSSSSFKLFVVFSLSFIFSSLPSSVLSFKAGHVEPVAGSIVPRNSRPLITGTANSSNRNSYSNSNQLPPTGAGSRSAILTKLTSPRREFGGHVYQNPASSHESPIVSDLYAFSKSQESHQNDNENNERAPFVRFPAISSPFSKIASGGRGTQSRESHQLRHVQPARQQQKKKDSPNASSSVNKLRRQQGHVHQTPFAQSVSDLLAQREEPSSLFGSGAAIAEHDEDVDDLLFDSYYTTGSDDHVLSSSQVDNDRYASEENSLATAAREDDLFEKQSATGASSLDASSSLSPSSTTPTNTSSTSSSSKTKSTSSNENVSYLGDYSAQASDASFGNGSGDDDDDNNNNNNASLSKPTLLPLPANYLSLATFRQIDNTLEKSSSNILSRIANFWRNRTMSSQHASGGNSSDGSRRNSSSGNLSSPPSSNILTKLSSSSNHSNQRDDSEHTNLNAQFDNAFLSNLDDAVSRDGSDGKKNRSRGKSENKSNSSSQRKKGEQQNASDNVAAHPQRTKYVSIEHLDDVSIGGGQVASTANSNQYLSLDDDEGRVLGLSQEDFALSTGGGNTKEADEHTATVTKSSTSKQKDDHLDDQLLHHDHHSISVEDYITGETTSSSSSGAVGLEEWLGADSAGVGDSAHTSHTFHDDLFHTTPGTITAVIDNSSGSSKSHHKKDLVSSGSSKIERVQKGDSESKRISSSTSVGGVASSVSKGDLKRAESEKIWSSIDSHFGRHDLIESTESEEEHDYYYGMTIGGFLKRELWTIPLFVLASLNMILIILFEVYVLCRARGTSRRHLFLGQMLLFGLFLCSFLALMFAVHPSIIGCFVGRLGVGITYSLIFSVLMVKCVFLLSLDTGVYLPTSYQGILLFFAVAVQVAIDTQWVIMYPPFLQCGTSFVQLLYSLSYVGVLVLIVGLLAGRAAYKGVVENYREAVYILITAVVTVPVALSWTVAGWMLQGRHQDACVSFGLVAHSLTIFLIMFMPKGRQLASLDKEAVCFEDQEDQCSGYSPSFFHFKPTTKNYKTALWGDGNLYTTLEPTVSTINPNVFFHRNDFHSGMIY